jgi:hypothetical protein
MFMNNRKIVRGRWVVFSMILFGILSLNPDILAQRPFPQNPRFPNMAPPQPPKPQVLKMRVIEGEVTAEISDCPLHNALKELAERTGIMFEVRSEPNPLVSVKLYGIPLRDAIPRIAVNSDIIFFYDESKPVGIAMVRVLPRTKSVQQPGIFYLGSGAVTKISMEIKTPEQAEKVLATGTDLEDREKAIEVLVKEKGDPAIRALTNALADNAPEIRIAAIEGLVAMNARKSLPKILKNLKDIHPGVRQSAVTAVALLGSARNLRDLKPLITDTNANVSAAAESAIRKLSAAAKP